MKLRLFKIAVFIFIFSIYSSQFSFAQMFWNHACQFAGTSSSYISVPHSSTINLTGSFTFEAWINPLTTNFQGIIAKGGPLGINLDYGLRINTGGRFYVVTNGSPRLMSKTITILPTNRWSYIAATYNLGNNTFTLYFNGVLDTSVVMVGATPSFNTDSLFIGISGASTPFSGQMDEVRLWSRALSATEVSQYFRTSLAARSGVYNGLVMSMPFQGNNALGTFTLVDATGNANNGFNRNVSNVDQSNRPYLTIMPNEALELDGIEDYLASPDAIEYSPTIDITLEAWIYPRNTNPFIIITKGTDYRLNFNGTSVTFSINNILINTNIGLPITQWSHIALSYEKSTGIYAFYLNGILQSSANINAGNINDGTDSLYIGGGPDDLFDLSGYIDEVRISHYVKSQSLIYKYLYQSIENSNEPNPALINVVFSFDGSAFSGADGSAILTFRNNARFSHPGRIAAQPVSPLERIDKSGFPDSYYLKTSNKRVPLSGTLGTTIDSTTINLNSTITDVNLFVALNHTSSTNLDIVLVAPNGDSVKVSNNKSTISLDENLTTVFDDQADSSLIDNRYSSFFPKIRPENNLNSVFNGDNTQGLWRLIVRDEVNINSGFLYAWGIQFNNMSERPKDLNLSALIQGFYNVSTNLMIPDTMRVYLRNTISPFTIVDSSKARLNNLGLGLFSFSGNVDNDQFYYIQLKHRNSIETWSNTFSFVNDEAGYSFLTAASAAFGNNQIQVDNSPVRFAIYGGDVNQDDIVDAGDLSLIDNDAFNSVSGYVRTDLNGDNFIDASDLSIADNNVFNGVIAITP